MSVTRSIALLLMCGGMSTATQAADADPRSAVDGDLAARFARLALDCVHREYPNKIAHVLNEAADAQPPSMLYPVFYGCFDWHSAVHGHWLLVRLLRTAPEGAMREDLGAEIETALDRSFTAEGIAGDRWNTRATPRRGVRRRCRNLLHDWGSIQWPRMNC